MAVIVCGADKSAKNISQYLKCSITQSVGDNEITVIALMSGSSEMAIRNMWESPFSGDSIGDAGSMDRFTNLAQVKTQSTAKTTLSSQLVWEGAEPPEVPIQLLLSAYSDAKHEVDDPINYLMQFSSANLRANMPIGLDGQVGRIPSPATFNIGRKMIAPMIIKDVSFDLNAPKTSDGYYAYNTVALTVSMPRMINRYDIPNVFPVA
ncbi:hypothetical protein I6Y99_004430 [Vibrio parahaemolyticus]|nr:hypothetical protein [Vibrio parahaemolyticus]